MRTFVVMAIIMTFSLEVFAQTRVRENIKQQSITGGSGSPVKVKPGRPVKK